MNLLEILSADAIKVPLEATDRKGVIDELVDLLAETGRITEAGALKDAVWQREQLRSTGIGEGLAIPHGKCSCTKELQIAIGRPARPIDFKSLDKKPTNLVVLLASPPDRTSDHIQALGKISRLMANPSFREAAYKARNAEDLYDLFEKAEQDGAMRV